MKKRFPALIATVFTVGFIAIVMLMTSANALMNKNGTVVSNAPSVGAVTNINLTQIDQLQARISEYEQRETQYQQLLQDSQDNLRQVTIQNQQYRQFILSLQQAGLIQVRSDGTVIITSKPSSN